ncbi:hypothetical protein QYE76_033300 [Lolium multiflorum]|uniref:Uncharacterized protein n=1 Tax=Lolium multiflorum TaxID=4521 RepID=A0AAD8QX72_LOLMU|nr:hypothetical protein QYE76_033300 [Lolium multiflorum]
MAVEDSTDTSSAGVCVVSRRTVQPSRSGEATSAVELEVEGETVHLTPWDLQMLTVDYIQKGVLLPNPPTGGRGERLVDRLASSFARALGRFYPFAGRLAVEERQGTVTVSLRCTGEGAEFVHAVAPGITVADVAASLYVPRCKGLAHAAPLLLVLPLSHNHWLEEEHTHAEKTLYTDTPRKN